MTLHDELGVLADTAPRPSIDHTLWDQGRALRRRDRLVTSAVVLALVVIVGGLTSLVLGPPRAFAPADELVPEGAIPSRIYELTADGMNGPLEKDLKIGRASVAFLSFPSSRPVIVGATDGEYHVLDLPGVDGAGRDGRSMALSPDGRRLAWSTPARIHIADLDTGDVLDFPHNSGQGARLTAMVWQADSTRLSYVGTTDGRKVAGTVDLAGPTEILYPIERTLATGLTSPARTIVALPTKPDGPNALFVRPARGGVGVDSDDGEEVLRPLPVDLYPDGASVRPLGWAADDLLLAEVNALNGSYLQGPHLALFTSPDRLKAEWTYRILVRNLPPRGVSVAVDLIPDLDGTSSQQLTHDFGEPDWPAERDISWIIGLGVAGALCVLYSLRWLWRRRTHLS